MPMPTLLFHVAHLDRCQTRIPWCPLCAHNLSYRMSHLMFRTLNGLECVQG